MEDLTCTVCWDVYTAPKILPCCHSFCLKCLQRIVNKDQTPLSLDPPTCDQSKDPSQPLIARITPCLEETESDEQELAYKKDGNMFLPREYDTLKDDTTDLASTLAPCSLDSSPLNSLSQWLEIEATTDLLFPTKSEELTVDHGMLSEIEITCPVCKEKHVLAAGGVNGLADDCEINCRLEQRSVQQSLTNKAFQCALCSSEDAVTLYCPDCGFLCDFCAGAHERQSQYKGHHSRSCDELSSETFIGHKKARNCELHNYADFIFFCNDCKTALCPKCVVGGAVDHRAHDYVQLEDSDQYHSDQSRSLTEASRDTLEKYRHYKDYIQRVEKEFLSSTHSDVLNKTINERFDSYIEMIQKKRQVLLDQVEEESLSSKKALWAQKEQVDRTITAIESGIKFAERVRTVHNLLDRIEMNSQVIARMSSVDSSWKPSRIKPPLVLKPTEKFIPSPVTLTTISDSNISLETEKPSVCQHELVVVKFSIPPLSKPHMRILHGKSRQILDENEVVFYDSEEKHCYNLEFVPRVAGEHVVVIELAGTLIAEKTFNVTGTPRYGNTVQCGPDWTVGLPRKQLGRVTSLSKQLGYDVVNVKWGDDEETSHMWGKDGEHDIELVPEL